MARVREFWPVVLTLGILASGADKSDASESYYLLVFGSQSEPKLLRYTHTWATFVKVESDGPDLDRSLLTVHTISWLPRSLEVRTFAPRAEPGVNLTLEDTLATVYGNGEHVTLWGPFVLAPELYERSLRVYQILNSGVVQYRAISTQYNLLISDCIHAVAAVDPLFGRGHYPLIRVGNPASRFIARQVMVRSYRKRGVDQAMFDNSWLIPRLGLDGYPITVVPPQQIPRRNCLLCTCPD